MQKVRSEGTEGDGEQVMSVMVVMCVFVCLVGKATIGNVSPKERRISTVNQSWVCKVSAPSREEQMFC
jgi:hypothetical protein